MYQPKFLSRLATWRSGLGPGFVVGLESSVAMVGVGFEALLAMGTDLRRGTQELYSEETFGPTDS